MKNNKGFSIIELVVSFSVCMVVVVVLFQIVISLKELYEKSGVKTELLGKQNLIVDQIYTDIYEKGLATATSCGDYCITFVYNDGNAKQLSYTDSKLKYGDYTTTINNVSFVGKTYVSFNNSIWNIQLIIRHKLFPDDNFGVRIVHYIS